MSTTNTNNNDSDIEEKPFVPRCAKCSTEVHYIDPEMFDLAYCQCHAKDVNDILICEKCTVHIEGTYPREKRYCKKCIKQ